MRIGELSSRTGVSRRSLRYYEEQGLVAGERSASGQRHYDDDQVSRVALIQALFSAGLSSRTMQGMLDCVAHPSGEVINGSLDVLAAEKGRVDTALNGLLEARANLDRMINLNLEYKSRYLKEPTLEWTELTDVPRG
jgi:DNA-binding transcriptional MerR regulator